MEISSTWQGGKLVTKAHGVVNAAPEIVINSHLAEDYSNVLGIKYSWFKRKRNHVACSFKQKIGPLSFDMTFEKIIERFPWETKVHYKTNDSVANMIGVWTIVQMGGRTSLSLVQELNVPAALRWLPIKSVVEKKVENAYKAYM
ncbi:hypothetical protein ATCVOR07043_1014L [Acanthocystis turfacea Chlorella virus OR0704.3]|nr:hypothetical protein ATCVOR07043_1014L [Acanthocystis turfacea Chlorella virus OR0704.3]